MRLILSVKKWRNELQRSGVEVRRLLVRGLMRLFNVEKRVLGFWQVSVRMVER